MGSISIVHWLVLLCILAIFGIPVAIILKRTGYSPALALLAIIPGVSLIGLWLFAFAKWPALVERSGAPAPKRHRDPA